MPIMAELNALWPTEMHIWDYVEGKEFASTNITIFSVDLKIPNNIQRLKNLLKQTEFKGKLVLTADKSSRSELMQAHALGANHTIAQPINATELIKTISDIMNEPTNGGKNAIQLANDTCLEIADMMDQMMVSMRNGGPLPFEEIHNSCENVTSAISEGDMKTWLKAVRTHSSYTYRHIMIVTGFAALFAVRFNMTKEDTAKLTLGALLHDVGKLSIPSKILDKPSKLTEREIRVIREHPKKGAELLERDGRFDKDLIMMVRNHHELLDGSGYPDGLKGDQIPDIVRIMTVVDIFSALIEARSYKASLSLDEAYNMLLNMGPKLDQAIVRGFEPIAYDNASHALFKKIKHVAA